MRTFFKVTVGVALWHSAFSHNPAGGPALLTKAPSKIRRTPRKLHEEVSLRLHHGITYSTS